MSLPAQSIIQEHLVCGMQAISAYALKSGCMINPELGVGVATRRGGWDIYLFFSRGHLFLRAMENDVARMCSDNLPMKQLLEPGWLCRIISGQLAVALFELAPREAKNRTCKIIHQ